MNKVEIAKLFFEEKASDSRPKCGCYVVDPKIKSLFSGPLACPLKHIAYDVSIVNNLAKIMLTQSYKNPLTSFLEV